MERTNASRNVLIGLGVVIDELPDNDELENDDFDEISSSREIFHQVFLLILK